MRRQLVGAGLMFGLSSVAVAQPAADVAKVAATVSRLSPEIGKQVGELYFKVHSAVVRRDVTEVRTGCESRQNAFKVFEPLYAPEVTGFQTQQNFDRHPHLTRQITALLHLSLDLRVVLNTVCGAAPPSQAELLAAYAIISNAYGLNRQMAESLSVPAR